MKKCPLIKKECIEHSCEWYTHLVGMNPQTSQPQDEWGCAVKWLPILLIEGAAISRQITAAVDRNNNTLFSAFPNEIQQRIVSSNPNLLNGQNGH